MHLSARHTEWKTFEKENRVAKAATTVLTQWMIMAMVVR